MDSRSAVTADVIAPSALEPAPVEFFAPVVDGRTGLFQRGLSGVLVVAVHLVILVLLVYAAVRPEVTAPIRALAVRMIEAELPKLPRLDLPKPALPQPAVKKVHTPPPVMTASKRDDAPASFSVAPQPETVALAAVQAPEPAPITAVRFDADYLQNSKPAYPPMSRRLGEDGKVVLRVRVSAQGLPLTVEVSKSSGFPRLDDAARAAVERWRFVPARQGNEPIEASVLVPLNFTLSN
jgi:protein TonB